MGYSGGFPGNICGDAGLSGSTSGHCLPQEGKIAVRTAHAVEPFHEPGCGKGSGAVPVAVLQVTVHHIFGTSDADVGETQGPYVAFRPGWAGQGSEKYVAGIVVALHKCVFQEFPVGEAASVGILVPERAPRVLVQLLPCDLYLPVEGCAGTPEAVADREGLVELEYAQHGISLSVSSGEGQGVPVREDHSDTGIGVYSTGKGGYPLAEVVIFRVFCAGGDFIHKTGDYPDRGCCGEVQHSEQNCLS